MKYAHHVVCCLFFFKQKTAYDMRISDWSSDVCSSDLVGSEYELDRPETLGSAAHCIRTNLDAPIAICTRLLPVLRARPEAAIVNVTSVLAIAPRAGGSVYCATTEGLRTYTKAIRHEMQDSTVRVIEALPTVVATTISAGRARK